MAQAGMIVPPDPQFFDNNGEPLAGGIMYFYEAGTTTPKEVFGDSGETFSLGVSVTLDSSGRAKIWLDGYYYVELYDALSNLIWTEDNVSGSYFPTPTSSTSITGEWILQSDALTYIGATQFSVPSDKTSAYSVGRRIKATVTAGTITGTITVSSAGDSPIKTTITVLWDLAEALDAGLSAVSLGIITPIANSLPIQMPIGAVIPWYKTVYTQLAYGWVQCDGQTLNDPLSPWNGSVIPNLNGAAGGADTFSNGKIGVFLRGNDTAGTYASDAIKAHNHGTSTLATSVHGHAATGLTAAIASSNVNVSINGNNQSGNNVNQTGSGNGFWQNAGSGGNQLGLTFTGTLADSTISVGGNTANSPALNITGSTDNNGAATETIPKTVTCVMIIKVK